MPEKTQDKKTIHIACAIEEAFRYPLAVMLVSCLENNRDNNVKVHLFSAFITDDSVENFKQIITDYNQKFSFYRIDQKKFENLPVKDRLSLAVYYRLIIPEIIEPEVEKILYLDADIIVRDNLYELFNTEMEGKTLGAINDIGGVEMDFMAKHNIPERYSFFNSGVLLIDKKLWIKRNTTERVLNYFIKNKEKCEYLDQDALNGALFNERFPVDPKWNQQIGIYYIDKNFIKKAYSAEAYFQAIDNPVIIHFNGREKPWHQVSAHPYTKEFIRYAKKVRFFTYHEKLKIKKLIKKYIIYGFIGWTAFNKYYHKKYQLKHSKKFVMHKDFKRKPVILYLTRRDAKDKREWSGTLFYMAKSLERHAGKVIYAGPYNPKLMFLILKIINKLSLLLINKRYCIPYNFFLTLLYKYRFTRIIKKTDPDIVFAAAASGEMCQLKIKQPMIYLGDITFNLLKDHYQNYQNLSRFSLWESDKLENKTFRKASALVFSSNWAADSAIADYEVSKEKIHIISYGANMDNIPVYKDAVNKRIDDKIQLLFLAVDWERKGGEIAFKGFLELQNRGYNVELTVCGCRPPEDYKNSALRVIPFLNKNNADDAAKISQLLLETHFLLVPSRSDCTPIVFCEANAFGIPVITSDAGGITSVITDGINGHTLGLNEGPDKYADIIEIYLNQPKKYQQIVNRSRKYYDEKLNWDTWGKAMSQLIDNLLVGPEKGF